MKTVLWKTGMKTVRTWNKVKCILKDETGENYVDVGVKILIAAVIGAILLAGLYALFGDVIMFS